MGVYGLAVVAHHVNAVLDSAGGQAAVFAVVAKDPTLREAIDEIGVFGDLTKPTTYPEIDARNAMALREIEWVCTEADTNHRAWVSELMDSARIGLQLATERLIRPRWWSSYGHWGVTLTERETKAKEPRIVLETFVPEYPH